MISSFTFSIVDESLVIDFSVSSTIISSSGSVVTVDSSAFFSSTDFDFSLFSSAFAVIGSIESMLLFVD